LKPGRNSEKPIEFTYVLSKKVRHLQVALASQRSLVPCGVAEFDWRDGLCGT
jgi:hypothetical protein